MIVSRAEPGFAEILIAWQQNQALLDSTFIHGLEVRLNLDNKATDVVVECGPRESLAFVN